MELDELNSLLKIWQSESKIYDFLSTQLAMLLPVICDSGAPEPDIQIVPASIGKGLFGEKHAGAEYIPAEHGKNSSIWIFTPVLCNRETATIVLAHELVHHWEHTTPNCDFNLSYPNEIDEIISEYFEQRNKEAAWRAAHSKRFLAKAYCVADRFGFPLARFLFGG